MYLSRHQSGFYYLWFKDESGKKQKVSTRTKSKTEALNFFKTFIQSESYRKIKLISASLEEFTNSFLNYSKGVHTSKTQYLFLNAFREFIRIIGNKSISKVTVRDIELFLSQKKQEASGHTARHYYVTLRSAFERAKIWGYISDNPFRKVEKPKTPELIPVYLTRSDFQVLLSTIREDDFRDLIIIAAYTGMRLGEILSLEWTDIDLKRRVIQVRNKETFTTKSKRNRVIPMVDIVYEAILRQKENLTSEHSLIFHNNGRKLRDEYVSKKFKRYIREAGLNDKIHFHSLRHTFCSWLAESGVSLYAISKLAGHQTISVTEKYSHLQSDLMHDLLNDAFNK